MAFAMTAVTVSEVPHTFPIPMWTSHKRATKYLHVSSFELNQSVEQKGQAETTMTTDALDGIPLYVEFAEEVSIYFEKCIPFGLVGYTQFGL